MTIERLLNLYSSGELAEISFPCYLLDLVTKSNADFVMERVPESLLEKIEDHVRDYEPNKRVVIGGGTLPTPEAVEAVQDWFKKRNSKL